MYKNIFLYIPFVITWNKKEGDKMDKSKKFYITQVNQNGELAIPPELTKNIYSGLIDIEIEGGRIVIKPSEPDYTLTWTPNKNK
ncbi:hypothetical protein ACH33_16820 [Aneurinibacillus sp. XH2]|nr:hypothetical protein ACH33_16820 [Aneurinibacillus sp. XH2]